jgi:DNA (cytosine-5)-methyltransferase 1
MELRAPGAMTVRRLTPTECERLQGFPDGYTLVPYRGKPAADSPRYKALGNSMAVPCMAWIGRRIQDVDALPDRASDLD